MAGESAQQVYEHARDRRRAAVRRVLPVLAVVIAVIALAGYLAADRYLDAGWLGLVPAVVVAGNLLAPSQREVAWRRGAEGERIVGAALDRLEDRGFVLLHDRLIPGSRANIDHLAVGPDAVFTVDAKRYRGRIEVRRGELFVAGRNRATLLDQARRQRAVVIEELRAAGRADVPVHAVLCFAGVEWPLLFPPGRAGDVWLCSPKGLRRRLGAGARQDVAAATQATAAVLDRTLVPARRPSLPRTPRDAPRVVDPPAVDAASPRGMWTANAPSPPAPRPPVRAADASAVEPCRCGAAMVPRTRRRDGAPFLGCSTFPACRFTRTG